MFRPRTWSLTAVSGCIESLGRDRPTLWDAGIYPGEPWVNCNFFSDSQADAEVFGFGITARVA